jgi:hypothetical protein
MTHRKTIRNFSGRQPLVSQCRQRAHALRSYVRAQYGGDEHAELRKLVETLTSRAEASENFAAIVVRAYTIKPGGSTMRTALGYLSYAARTPGGRKLSREVLYAR